ncbi:type I polyketide synthase [Kutzneria albida]|uniref:Modular polyketide synthase n=1 Tax=Kutzneria albida DSM 43870 TaxID=1449976 RepID=W5W9V3_9PSEU|nr:type I polyketide synthase [Kutzneria albida]AHH97316.1 modular polyketide synthase [Kutzneria albida DSM 43870]
MRFGSTTPPSSIALIGMSSGPWTVPPAEAARRALENAGIVPESLGNATVGVFSTAQADLIAAEIGVLGPVLSADIQPAAVVHLAVQSVHMGESELALAGVLSDVCGFLVLKRIASAIADGDPIHCVLDGSALGRGPVVRQACERAGVDQDGIHFLWRRGYHSGEAVLDGLFDGEQPLDEDDAAAALLELPVLLNRRQIPVPGVPLDLDRRLTAVLSSADGAGTACALVLSEPPARPLPPARASVPVLPLVLSADSEETLRGKAETLRAHLAGPEAPDLLDAAHTLALARSHLPHRGVVLGGDRAELAAGLAELAAGRGGAVRAGTERKVALMFPGEGGQRPGMGRELYPLFDVFADALDEVCDHLDAVSTWSVRELLLGEGRPEVAPADEALYTQDALFALQVALFRQFEHWGVRPDFVVGHSVGELAAATAAGVYSLPDVCALLAERIRLFREKTPVGGVMVAMRVTEAEARESLAGLEHLAAISAVNAPNSVVVSGDREAVLRVAGLWAERGRKVKQLPVDRAFHSPHMAAMAGDFEQFARGLSARPPRIPLIPVHTGLGADPAVVCLPEYWGAQVRGTGHFLNCVTGLAAAGVDTYVDMSANGVLAALVEETLPEAAAGDVLVTAALRGGQSDLRAVLGTLGELHGHGVPVAWSEVFRGWGGRRAHLPTEVAQPARTESRAADLPRLIRAEAESLVKADYRPDRSFLELGLDSVAAVELVNRLRRRTGLRIAATALFDHPTPNQLAAHLDGRAPRPAAVVPRRTGSEEPIAIVGMSCRFPGGVQSPEDLWQLVASGRDVIAPMPEDRGWDLAALYDPQRQRPGTSYVREGGFLHEAAEFDPAFFGIGGHEALEMDPQQRLLLELSWEALERAGIDPATLRGSDTGVYAGLTHSDYGTGPGHAGVTGRPHLAIGTVASVASGRISFTLGLQGPNLSIDTACSSSLVGVHLATTALRRGECSLALAGAVTVLSSPMVFVEFSRQGGLAPDARAKPFAEGADGTAWAEGGGMFLLERYSDARRNGHPVLALITGSAVNSDGASNGLTAPNGAAQQRLLASALADARLRPSDVDVVETHGTGTQLGDPIEAGALLAAYGAHRPPDRPLLVGSLKSNLGHTQAAAGAASVIKMVLAMRHGTVPATLNVDRPSSHVDWAAGLRLVTESTPWPDQGPIRRAGVSSFGIGGTNAHVILQQPPAEPEAPAEPGADVPPLWTVSGGSEAALRAQAARLAAHCEAHPELGERDLGFSLATARSALAHRAVLTGGDRDQLRRALTALAAGRTDPGLTVGAVAEGGLAFLFTGQGSQRTGMGRGLHERYAVFAAAFDEVCTGLHLPVRDVVFGADQNTLDRTEFAQTGLFAFEVALFRLLESWGIRPDLLLGHSIGELAAAHVAGVLSLPDACRLVAARGSLMQALPPQGAMYAVAASMDEVEQLPPGVSLAAVNGPRSVVLSGTEEAVAALAERFRAQGRRTKRLRVSHAFHSALMDPMLDEFRSVARSLDYQPPRIPIVSDLTGRLATDEQLCSPEYWVDHVRGTVRFLDGMRTLQDQGVTTYLELGPQTTLTEMAADCLTEAIDSAVIPGLREEDVLGAVAALHVRGHGPDWSAWYAGSGARRVDLPTYAFQRKRFWLMPEEVHHPRTPQADSVFWEAVASEDLQRLGDLLGTGADPKVTELLPAMARWRRSHDQDAAVDRLRYRITWQPVADQVARKRNWIVVHSADLPVPEPIRAALSAVVLPVQAGAGRADIAELLAPWRYGEPVDGVLSLLAWDERPHPGATEVPAGLALTTALIQAMGDTEFEVPLWCVTQAAVSTGHGDRLGSPVQAMVWGLGRVAALEHPQRWGGLVDLPSTLDFAVAERLAGVLSASEDQVAVRASGVFARRLLRAPAGTRGDLAPREWPRRGTTLITGAFGALGRQLARWLAAEGVQRLLLTGRHANDPEFVAELTALGAEVDAVACDVADRQAVAALLAGIPADRPLTAVAHAAGVLDDGVIDALDPQRLARVLHAKVGGARNLHELAGGLDAFVLFSSATGAVGNAGQANYAAANTYLDALADQRRAEGLAATSLAWGPWGAGGMAVDGADAAAVGTRLRRNGMTVLDPELGIAALAAAFAREESGLVIADVDWDRFLSVFATTRHSPLLAELPEVRQSKEAEPRAEASELVARLAGMSQAERVRALRELVCQHTALILGHDSAAQVQPGKPFHEQGLSSLGVVELRNQLSSRTGLRVPASALFDHPTPTALAGYLDAELTPDAHPEPAPEPPAAQAEATDLDDALSRAEREISLAAEGLLDG